MKPFIALVMILASLPVYDRAAPIGEVFFCIGEGKSEGYPFCVQKTGKHLFRVINDGQRSTVFRVAFTEKGSARPGRRVQ